MAMTTIEWCDYTFNPWRGCTKVAAGCQHCYAESLVNRYAGRNVWGPRGVRILAAESTWKKPMAWNRKAEREGVRSKVFCASLADVFEHWRGPLSDHNGKHVVHTTEGWHAEDHEAMEGCSGVTIDDARQRLFALIAATPNLDWLLLTKRPENIRRMWPARECDSSFMCSLGARTGVICPNYSCDAGDGTRLVYRPNVWLLASVATQEDAERNIPELLKCRDLSPVLGLSCEPLLGRLDLRKWLPQIDWIIAGGESGPHARPMHPEWVRSLRDQCDDSGVPFFFKQWGEWAECPHGDPAMKGVPSDPDLRVDHPLLVVAPMKRAGKTAAGRLLDGREYNATPERV